MPKPYMGERDALLFRAPLWLGKKVREEATRRGIPYNDVILEILAPAFQDAAPAPEPEQQSLPMAG